MMIYNGPVYSYTMCSQKPSVALIFHNSAGWGLILEYQLDTLKISKIIPAGLLIGLTKMITEESPWQVKNYTIY